MQTTIQHLFQVTALEDVPRERLESFVEEYPFFGYGHYLLSRKLKAENSGGWLEETHKTSLYFSNPFWLQWLLENRAEAKGPAEETPEETTEEVRLLEAQAPTPDLEVEMAPVTEVALGPKIEQVSEIEPVSENIYVPEEEVQTVRHRNAGYGSFPPGYGIIPRRSAGCSVARRQVNRGSRTIGSSGTAAE